MSTASSSIHEEPDDTEFAKPIINGKTFNNPKSFNNWGGIAGFTAMMKWKFLETDNSSVPTKEEHLDKSIPVTNISNFASKNPKSKLFATWLGHATVLLELEGVRMITDPIWADRASFLSFAGPKRYRPPPMKIEDLPKLDIGVISHDHYDHLDINAVQKITSRNPSMRWYVPLKMKDLLASNGVSNDDTNPSRVTEMSWGESHPFEKNGQSFRIWCLPAQHWGQRGAFDRFRRLWSGWALIGPSRRFYYSGDTGNCDKEFRKIGQRLGPFDLAAIPIGAYEPNWFMKSQHINPEEAVGMHELIRSKMSIGIHWGTYPMGSYEHYLEPRDKLYQLMANRPDLSHTRFVTIGMGEIWEEEQKDE